MLENQQQQYVKALEDELAAVISANPSLKMRPISSVFFGGGTPSIFSAASILQIIALIRSNLNLNHDAEITLEANPQSADIDKFNAFYAAGVNRLSIGVQSFNDKMLQQIGRIHNAATAKQAVRAAVQAGFGTAKGINIDLMFALPAQTLSMAEDDIAQAIELGVAHISHYQLTIEAGTAFYYRPPVLPSDDNVWQMQHKCQLMLENAAYMHYEVSAFALADKKCKHNLNYWRYGDYLGLGAGAHSKLSSFNSDGSISKIVRKVNHSAPAKYMRLKVLSSNVVKPAEQAYEFMLNAMRLNTGFELSLLSQNTQLKTDAIAQELARLADKELLDASLLAKNYVQPTALGKQFLNDLLLEFLPN